ncbi:MAG: sugar kinase [Nitrososphaeria archaeon]
MALDLIGLGSAIIDFAPREKGVPLSRVKAFFPSAGGSVSNILVEASRLGLRTGFLGCVGDDEFGTLVLNDFKAQNVDTSHVKRVKGFATGIAFYSIDETGDRHYIFYRFPGYSDPETMLKPEDIDKDYIAGTKMFHYSEAMLRKALTRETVLRILQIAKEHKVAVSYDPNVREALWNNKEEFQSTQRKVLSLTEVFLSTSREAALIAGGSNVEETLDNILRLGPSTVVIREGERYHVAFKGERMVIPIFKVKAVDTSGAGDVFVAGFLTGLAKQWSVDRAVMLGSAVAAIKVMKAGTRGKLPTMRDAITFLKERGESFSRREIVEKNL